MKLITADDIETTVGRSTYQQPAGAVLSWHTVFPESHTVSVHFCCVERLMMTVWIEPVPFTVLIYYTNMWIKTLGVITSRANS
jgi:hypothetical protein